MTTDTTERDPGWRTVWAAGLVVAAGAGLATAHGLYQVAAAARVPRAIGWLYPLITDGLALVAYAATARLHAGGRRYAAGIVILAAGLSGLAQAVYLAGALDHTGPAPVGLRFGVGAWPAVAAALTAHLLHLVATGASSPAAANMTRSAWSQKRAPANPAYNAAPYNAASTPAVQPVQPRPTDAPATKPIQPADTERLNTPPAGLNTGERSGAGDSARERARAAARHHHARHGALPTVTELTNLANVARGTAANALKDLRAERPALHVVNADPENRTDQ